MVDVDWQRLSALAVEAMERAYCPYSGFPVGAAGRLSAQTIREGRL